MSQASFGARFEALLGTRRVAEIIDALGTRPVLLLAGDPGVGKSSVARALAARIGGAAGGTGACVRAEATRRGFTLEAFNSFLVEHPEEDISIDAAAAITVACGDVAVFESRLAGHLGWWLRGHGRAGLRTVYLQCAPHEQARRLLAREGASARHDATVSRMEAAATLADCARVLRDAGAEMEAAAEIVEAQASRMTEERRRLYERYGAILDDPTVYDEMIDTTQATIEECVEWILRAAGGCSV